MLYIDVRDNGKMEWRCHFCNEADAVANDKTNNQSLMVSSMNYNNEEAKYRHLMTANIHNDPTIPRVSNITCINPKCTKPPEEKQVVAYIKYDYDNLRYIYSCSFCKHFWVTGSSEVFPP